MYLNNLGMYLGRRYERTGDMADLEASIRVAHQAVDFTSEDHPDRVGRLNVLGTNLGRRYERTGDMADLEAAIRAAHQAVDSTPKDHPVRAMYLNNLGSKLDRRYRRTGDMADLEAAIKAAQQAVDSTSKGHPDRAGFLNNLGNKLDLRYVRIGSMVDLEAAIQAVQQAIDSKPEDHPSRVMYLNNLVSKLGHRYERTGNMADLEAAIQAVQQTINSTPEDHPDWAGRLNSLGNNLNRRYRRTGDMADLEAAIRAAQQAVDSTPKNHPDRPGYLDSLGNNFEFRYQRTDDMADLEDAIRAAQQAVDSTPKNHPDRPGRLNNLGSKLGLRYQRIGSMADPEAAVQAVQQAVDSTPEDHPDRAMYLNNLGNELKSRYVRTGDIADLEAAIQAAQQAVDSTPEDHPGRAGYLNNLGIKLESRFERTCDMADLEKSSSSFSSAWKCNNSIPFRRIRAAARAVNVLGRLENLESAAQLAQDAINLLPTISNRSLQRSDQQYAVSHFSGLAASACSIFLRLNLPEQALEILEKGRTTILSQLIGDRIDILNLSEEYPNLAHRFESLLDEINAPLLSQDDAVRQQALQRRRDGVAAFDLCVQDIRNILGYERFLLGLTRAEMRVCASEGPIVVVNVTDLGSHAIIVSLSEIKSLELPKLSPEEARSWVDRQWSTGRKALGSDNKDFREYLAWLWEVCVREILRKCDLRVQHSKRDLPRIWWIGTGLASSMPFHAAGDHSFRSDRNLFTRAISSYTPSIKALAYSRERLQKNDICGENMLLATMTTTPGLPTLPGVEVEKKAILERLPAYFKSEVHDHPSALRIIQSLEHCSIAHFACHGFSDHTDPSKNGLVFQKKDGLGRFVQDAMSVHDVSKLKLERARIAYLSACSTAENGAARLRDEVIHIVSGFQVAGFAHVVGCLWPSADAVCVEVAKGFYSELFKEGVEIEDKDVAMALHEAIRVARETDWDQPLKWAQFVHYGA
jgi:tetratricopeptide (TPR) repeat protein